MDPCTQVQTVDVLHAQSYKAVLVFLTFLVKYMCELLSFCCQDQFRFLHELVLDFKQQNDPTYINLPAR